MLKKRGRPKKVADIDLVEENAEIAPKNEENYMPSPTEAEIAEAGIKELKKLYTEMEERGVDSVGKLLRMIERAELKFKEILSR